MFHCNHMNTSGEIGCKLYLEIKCLSCVLPLAKLMYPRHVVWRSTLSLAEAGVLVQMTLA